MKNLKKPSSALLLATMIFSNISVGLCEPLEKDTELVYYDTALVDKVVYFKDVNLRIAINTQLGKDENQSITKKELESLKSLYLENKNIKNLEGLRYCVNLENLNLGHNQITSIDELSSLLKLEKLSLNNNNITNIEPLKNLFNLEMLSLSYNNISNIKPLSKLKKLEVVYLEKNNISDVSYVAYLTNLTDLNLRNNKISDISSLKNMPNTSKNAYIDLTVNDLNLNSYQTIQTISALSVKGYNVIYENQRNNNLNYQRNIITPAPFTTTNDTTTDSTTTDDSIKPETKPEITVTLVDVKNHWAEDVINRFITEGYVNGYEDKTFRPNNEITRAEFIKIFNRYFGLTNKTGKVASDTLNHWAKDEMDIALSSGIIQGYPDGTLRPDAKLTREEAAKIISNYTKLTDTNYNKLDSFTDSNEVSPWAKSAMEAMLDNKYINGYENNTLRPKNNLTRAEAVTILGRINRNIK